ncbi:MAG TPA: copper transporter [Microthrixaceae bacterium]|nr:copper transporter [Microthrixaceae bacterium]
MINFRFHLVSLVAVFLALGVGVAMGASFIDRATVDTLRNRVDDLEDGYRARGTEIDELRDHLRTTDEELARLLGEDGLLSGRLEGEPLAVIAPAGLDDAAVDATWAALEAAGAVRSATVRLEPTLELDDEASMAAARELLGLHTASPSLVRSRLLARLADSLAVLTAPEPPPAVGTPDGEPADGEAGGGGDAPDGGAAGDEPAGAVEGGSAGQPATPGPGVRAAGPSPTPEEVQRARTFLEGCASAGLLSIDPGASAAAFPDVTGVSYVMLLANGMSEQVVGLVHRLADEVADLAPATVTVVETAAPVAPGELPAVDRDRVGALLVDLRNDDEAVERLSTVDHPDELLRRASTVLALQEQLAGEVGHYGVGVGATSILPTVPG